MHSGFWTHRAPCIGAARQKGHINIRVLHSYILVVRPKTRGHSRNHALQDSDLYVAFWARDPGLLRDVMIVRCHHDVETNLQCFYEVSAGC